MVARRQPTGEWCSPTREIPSSRLIRLIDDSRRDGAVVEMVHDAPTRQCPTAALELLERARCNSMLINVQSLGDPDPMAIAEELAAPDPGPATLRFEFEIEQEAATLTYAPMTKNAMPPTAGSASSIAIGARRGGKCAASVRLFVCLGALVFLGLGVLVFLGLGTWG